MQSDSQNSSQVTGESFDVCVEINKRKKKSSHHHDHVLSNLNSTAITETEEKRNRKPFPVSPIAAIETTRTRFAKRLEQFAIRGQSPLVGSTESDDTALFNQTDENTQLYLYKLKESKSDISTYYESGYSSSSWTNIKPQISQGSTDISKSAQTTANEESELKLSQIQGTSTPRSRLAAFRNEQESMVLNANNTSLDPVNPFETCLLESLHTNTCSPSVFATVISPSNRQSPEACGFRWSIDHMAVLNPADIDESQVIFERSDPATEAIIQSAIDHFWTSQKQVVPSPSEEQLSQSRLLAHFVADSTSSREKCKLNTSQKQETSNVQNTASQTMLTFPPNLDLNRLLGGCFEYNEDTQSPTQEATSAADLSVTSLRRKLFSHDKREDINYSSDHSMHSSIDDDDSNEFAPNDTDMCESPPLHHSSYLRSETPPLYDFGQEEEQFTPRRCSVGGNFSSPDISPIKEYSPDTHERTVTDT